MVGQTGRGTFVSEGECFRLTGADWRLRGPGQPQSPELQRESGSRKHLSRQAQSPLQFLAKQEPPHQHPDSRVGDKPEAWPAGMG